MTLPLAALLVGGQSRRFGSDKSAQMIEGRTFLQTVLDAVVDVGLSPVLVGGSAPAPTGADHRHLADASEGSGPPAGLVAALRVALDERRPGVFLLACDQPGVTAELLRFMIDKAAKDPAAPLAFDGSTGLEPFPAYYPVEAIAAATLARSLREVLDSARPPTRVVSSADRAEFPERVFSNINTPEDLVRFLSESR